MIVIKEFFGEAHFNTRIIFIRFAAHFYGQRNENKGDEKGKLFDFIKRIETAQDYRQYTKNWAMKPNVEWKLQDVGKNPLIPQSKNKGGILFF